MSFLTRRVAVSAFVLSHCRRALDAFVLTLKSIYPQYSLSKRLGAACSALLVSVPSIKCGRLGTQDMLWPSSKAWPRAISSGSNETTRSAHTTVSEVALNLIPHPYSTLS